MLQYIKDEFKKHYGHDCQRVFFAPARVNLIGEHIDYNGGLVMPAALENGTYLALRTIDEPVFKFRSLNFPDDDASISANGNYLKNSDKWTNYPIGVIDIFTKEGFSVPGIEFLFYGNIPNGAGLSSSASIEMVTALAINELTNAKKDNIQLALLSQKVENHFVGVNSGIMDQFAVGMGKKDQAIILNCETLEYSHTPFVLKNETLLIINTNKQRTLADSKYNERRATCEAALEIFRKKENFANLCSVPFSFFEENKNLLTDEMIQRVRHVITENQRVHDSEKALKNNDITAFGKLMNASHQSLMDDYEVTGKELDTVYLESLAFDGVVGCRMTGAGFGGCAIALVKNEKAADYKAYITEKYAQKIGYEPTIYEAKIGDGVREL
ncbi:MAG: galactokinase [Capnocytophaga sp.]|nr:galactokinase [Capnocytophaga sp.]